MKSNGKGLGFMGDFTLANPRNGLGLVDPNFSLPWLFLSHGFALQFFLSLFLLTHGRTHPHLGAPKFLLVAIDW